MQEIQARQGGGINRNNGTVNLYNTIITLNTAFSSGPDIFGTVLGYNSLSSYTEWGGENNYVYDPNLPLFRNVENGDYRLHPGSQASNRGNNQYAYNAGLDETSLDMAGEPRITGDRIDIGAYESSGFTISQNSIYVGEVTIKWEQYKNTANVRLTWISGTNAMVLGTFASPGEYVWDTTQYVDGYGQLKVEFLDENGKAIATSVLASMILNDRDIVVHRDDITENQTWGSDQVHLVVGRVNIKSGIALTIAEGTIVKFWKNAYLYNESGASLTIQTNAVLTRAEDDEEGGDTNKDSELSVAKMGNSYIRGAGAFEMADSVQMKYVTTTTSGTISADQTWFSGQVYHVTGTVTINSGATLTIMPGAIVKFNPGCSLIVQSGGRLVAEGNVAQPIVFTSVKDDSFGGDTNEDDGEYGPQAGDWNQIRVDGGSILFNHVILRYAGNVSGSQGAIYSGSASSSIIFNNSLFEFSKYYGISLDAGTFTASNSVFRECQTSVFNFHSSSSITARITNCTIGQSSIFLWCGWGDTIFQNCVVFDITSKFVGLDDTAQYSNCIFYNPPNSGPQTFTHIGTNNNIWANPLFRNTANGDYHLMAGSPCIDAGNGTVAMLTDITGAPRYTDLYSTQSGAPNVEGVYVDIGAYEFTDSASSSIDLEPVNVQAPVSVTVGDTVTIQWTIRNNGTVAATGAWMDAVYLVNTYGQKIHVKDITHSGNIAAGDLQTFYAEVVVPTVTDGNWTFAIHVNPNREIFEGIATDNNYIQTQAITTIGTPTLVLSDNFTVTKSPSVYKLVIPAREEYYLKYSYHDNNALNRITITAREGYLPTEFYYDWSSSAMSTAVFNGASIDYYDRLSIIHIPYSANTRTVYVSFSSSHDSITGTLERVSSEYRIFGFGNGIYSETTNSVTHERKERYYDSVQFDETCSITLIGSGFTDGMTVILNPVADPYTKDGHLDPFNPPVYPWYNSEWQPIVGKVTVESSTKAVLTFDMDIDLIWTTNYAKNYDLVVSKDAQHKTFPEGIHAFPMNRIVYSAPLSARLSIPDSIRADRVYSGTITYSANNGDILAPLFVLQGNSGMKLSLTEDFSDATNTLQVMGIGSQYSAGVLSTDGNRTLTFFFTAESSANIDLGFLFYRDTDPCADTTYFATWKEYHESLCGAITRLNLRGKMCCDPQKAYQLAVMEKEGYDINAVSGHLTNEFTGEVVANVSLMAKWTDADGTLQSKIVKTDANGFFSVEYLPNNVTVTLDCIDGAALSKTSFTITRGDVNNQRLTVRPYDTTKTRSAGVSGDILAYVEYATGSLKNNQAAEMSLVVRNTGNTAVDSALVFIQVTDASGNQKGMLTLDELLKGCGYVASTLPDGFSNALQIMSGTIQPGETVTIPIYWGGAVRPWDTGSQTVQVGILQADETEAFDLEELETSMRPDDMSDTQWNIVWSRYSSMIGTTWGSYVQTMGELQAYLASVGSDVHDAAKLNQILLAWAMDTAHPMTTLTTSTDNLAAGSVSSLEFSRAYTGGTIGNRFTDSDLGLGWDHNWNYSLTHSNDGNVTLDLPQGISILYQVNKIVGGKTEYRTRADGGMTLVRNADQTYTLTSLDNTVYAFDANGFLTSMTDTNGNTVSLTYVAGKLTTVTDTQSHSLSIAWNAAGKIASVTDSYGQTTTYSYDASNRYLTTVTWSDGRTISYEYDQTAGNTLSAIKSITFADGTHRYFSYNELGRVYESHADNNSASVSYVFGDTTATLFTYKVYSGSDLQGTVYLNELGQTAKTVDAMGHTTTYEYDAHGWLTQTTDSTGGITEYTYDALGNVLSVSDAAGNLLGFTYTATGDLSQLTDASGNTTTFVYDTFGNLTTQTRADETFVSYTHNADGSINTYATRAGETFVYAYNADGSVASVTLSTETAPVQYEYDDAGNLTKITDSNGDVTLLEYNAANLLTKVTYANGRFLQYSYDSAGRQTAISDGGEYCVKYTYNTRGLLASVLDGSDNDAIFTAYEYDLAGNLVKETNGNGTYTQYTYDSLERLTRKATFNASGAALSAFDYTYDTLSLISTMTTLDGTWTYGYDAIGQVVSTVFVGLDAADNYSAAFVYDANGNRTSATIDGVTRVYSYNAMNQLLSDGEFTYTYNVNGSLLTKTDAATGEVWTYSWNLYEELIAVVSTSSESWEYAYDANGNRTSVVHTDAEGLVTTTEYLYDPTGLGWIVAAYVNGELTETYAYGYGLTAAEDASGADYYYGFDHLGSTSVMTDASGIVLNEYTYDTFGNVLTSTETVTNDFQFVGAYGVVSETAPDSLLHMRARYYDAAAGRFISEDPLDLAAGDTNLYRYCGNGVTMAVDPSGNIAVLEERPTTKPSPPDPKNPFNPINDPPPHPLTPPDHERKNPKPGKEWISKKTNPIKNQAGKKLGTLAGKMAARHGAGLVAGNLGPQALIPFDDILIQGALVLWDLYDLGKFALDLLRPDNLQNLDNNRSNIPQSYDPNEMNGPVGYDFVTVNTGTEEEPFLVITTPNWIQDDAQKDQAFKIYFENKSTATAAAQEVFVTTTLPEEFNWDSFTLSEICIGNQVFNEMVGYTDGVWTVNQTSTGDQIQISVTMDYETGTAHWYLRSWVTTTADNFPIDAYAGFLPPNNKETHDGEGYVSFTVRMEDDLASGTRIETFATIVFDTNEPIVTNTWINTIDDTEPTSEIVSTVYNNDNEEAREITVVWSGADEHSGIACYDVYYSTDGGEYYEKWFDQTTDTTSVFSNPDKNTIYTFKVIAYDNVGNTNSGVTAKIEIELEHPSVQLNQSTYAVQEGCNVYISGAGSTGTELTYWWDLSGTGAGEFVSGEAAFWLAAKEFQAGPKDYTIRLKVKNKFGIESQPESVTIQVVKTTPSLNVQQTSLLNGQVVKLQLNASCYGGRAVKQWVINWGDNQSTTIDCLQNNLTVAHYYDPQTNNVPITVTLTETDDSSSTFVVGQYTRPDTPPAAANSIASSSAENSTNSSEMNVVVPEIQPCVTVIDSMEFIERDVLPVSSVNNNPMIRLDIDTEVARSLRYYNTRPARGTASTASPATVQASDRFDTNSFGDYSLTLPIAVPVESPILDDSDMWSDMLQDDYDFVNDETIDHYGHEWTNPLDFELELN